MKAEYFRENDNLNESMKIWHEIIKLNQDNGKDVGYYQLARA